MKKLKMISLTIFFSLAFLSCKDNFEKKVYFNFSVGGSKANSEKAYEQFRKENSQTNLSQYPYYKHQFQNQKNYYSSPLFQFAPNDTIVHTVSILYATKPQDLDLVLNSTKQGLLGMQPYTINDDVTPIMVFDDISKELESKYGKYDDIDTLDIKRKHIIKEWKNRDGIDIILNYVLTEEYFIELTQYYSLSLKFTLTDELKSSLIKNKTIY